MSDCKACDKQYTGKTTDHFRSRWNNYKSEARKGKGGNMENIKQRSSGVTFYNQITKAFLKT